MPKHKRKSVQTRHGKVTGLLSLREAAKNRSIKIKDAPKKHPRNAVIDKAVDDAVNATEGAKRPPPAIESIMKQLFGGT